MDNFDPNKTPKKQVLSAQIDLSKFEKATEDEKRQQDVMSQSTSFFKDGMRKLFKNPLAVASIVCGIFYAQMKTANEQTHANAYMPAEGLALSVVEDTYTHTTETETYDPVKDNSSSSGSSTDSDGFGGRSGGKF